MNMVFHDGMTLLVSEDVLTELGLTPGQSITDDQLPVVIAANARSFCRAMDKRRAEGKSAPDIAKLAALCGHRGLA